MEAQTLETIRETIDSGAVSTATLGELYGVAAEAVQRGDAETLTAAHQLAESVVTVADEQIRVQAAQLVVVFDEFFERLVAPAVDALPGTLCGCCGRQLDGSPVRCRFCGELLL
jgi:hypothetical protein